MFFLYCVVVLLTLILWILLKSTILKSQNTAYNFPKGPLGLPVFGNFLQIVKNPHIKYSEWTKKYGNLYRVNLGSIPALVISDAVTMKEIFSTHASTGKFRNDTTLLQSLGPYGILNTEGKESFEERQFYLNALKKFGLGKGFLEQQILEEAIDLCDWIKSETSSNGKIVLNAVLKKAANNALWTIITGQRVTLQDSQVADLMENWVTTFQYTMKTGLAFLPWLKNIAPKLSGYTDYHKACVDIHDFVKELFREHKKTQISGSPRDLVDMYNDRIDNTDEEERERTWKNSVATIANLFIAGGETTASTINWLIYNLVQHPNVQKKVHEEIDAVIGNTGEPNLDDQSRMPYMEAVILETLRYPTIAPFGVPHQLLEDLKFRDYHIPKGVILIPNIYHCHKDTLVWKDPDVFYPERFLDGNEASREKIRKNLVPFQLGRRQCIGESFARDVLFLFAVKLLQQFEILPDNSVEMEEYGKPNAGVLLLPQALPVVMKKRKQ